MSAHNPNKTGNQIQWFQNAAFVEARRSPGRRAAVQVVAALVVAGLLYLLKHPLLALVPVCFAAVVGMVSLISPSTNESVQRLLEYLGEKFGQLVSLVILTPVFLIFFSLARLFQQVGGLDPLGLKPSIQPTFWRSSDAEARKRKFLQNMFCTEAPSGRSRTWLAWGTTLVLFLLAVEVGLRCFGFGDNVLYLNDELAGYFPAPNQNRKRYAGVVQINNYGMRRPDITRENPAGKTRVLLLGDSTLYGGSYIPNEKLYARRLEKLLNERGGAGHEVLNMGVNGWGPYQELGYVQRFGTFGARLAVI